VHLAKRLALLLALWMAGMGVCIGLAAYLGLAAKVLWLALLWGWGLL
jgi:hypothetical protein